MIMNIYKRFIKRMLDLLFSLLLLIPATLILPVLCIVIYIETNENPIFIQTRPGLNGKTFNLYKLKSMRSAYDQCGSILSDNQRITKSGKLIRKLSLDEFPQIFNIIKGDMSFIGPRPLLAEYLPLYNSQQMRRHEVLPGITGWAQVNGRNAITWENKFDLDLYYVENISLKFDIKILLLTISKLFINDDVNASKNDTMPDFKGTKE